MQTAAPVFKKTRLGNGLRIVTEQHAGSRAVSCGLWVDRGTRDEAAHMAGVAHFVEHLVFKRSETRSAFEIARAMEAVGGDLNAFTAREHTCFVTHSLKEHLALSIDVLTDLVFRARFDARDFEKEKQVVIQEIHMAEDQHEDYIFDLYFEKLFPRNPLGRAILGSQDSIIGLNLEDVRDHWQRAYVPENMIFSAAGNLEHEHVVELVEKLARPHRKPRGAARTRPVPRTKPRSSRVRAAVPKAAEQTHILLGLASASFRYKRRFEGYVVNTLLGGGMTSKLYQSIREERGLAYAVYSSLNAFTDTGVNLIYVGTEAKHARKTVALVEKELRRLRKSGISRADLTLYKTQVSGQILLGCDDIENRMNSIGLNEMAFGRYRSPDEVLAEISAVTRDSVQSYIEKYIDPERLGMLLLGAIRKEDAAWIAEG